MRYWRLRDLLKLPAFRDLEERENMGSWEPRIKETKKEEKPAEKPEEKPQVEEKPKETPPSN